MTSFSNFKSQLVSAATSAAGIELGGGATTVYATVNLLPRTGIDAGATAFVTETSRFYIWNGIGWFNVAVVNNTPTITNAPSATYNLFANGAPTIITLAATDADGDTLTWSYSAPGAAGKATITQADNVFTITPLTDIADTSFTIDFEVTDGINISTASSTVNIDNRSPVIDTASAATYVLATDGSPTVITLAATDPDGGSITWTYADSGLTDQATVVQDGNEFTITPNSTPAAYADFTLTFTASDSIESTSTSPTTLSLTFTLLADEWSDTVLSIGTSSTDSLDNSTFIDRSTNAHTVTPTGTPTQTVFHPYLDNWSVDFNNDGYLSIPNSTDFNLDQNVGFTIEFWIKPRAGSTFGTVFCYWHYPEGYRFDIAQDGTAMHWYMDTGGNQITFSTTPNEWYHVAIVGDGAGTTTGYLNGVSVGTTTRAYVNVTNGRIFNIGSVQPYGSLSYRHASNLSNFRFVNGSTVYSGNFTPPTEKLTAITNTKLLTCQSNRFIDNSSSAREISLVGTPKVSAFNPFGQGSEYAVGENKGSMTSNDDTSNYISFDRSAIGESDDIALSFWVYLTDDAYENWYTDSGDIRFLLYGDAAGTELELRISGTAVITTTGLTKLEWHHVEVNRASGTWYLYVDGEHRDNSTTHGTTSFGASTQYIAYNTGASTNTIKGYISDYYFSIGNALHASTSNFTPPTAPVGSTNADVYLPMDNAGIFDKTGNYTLTLTDVTTSTTQTKYASSVLSIGGTGNRGYVILPSSTSLLNANDIVTIEGWVYFSGDNSGDNPGFFGSGLHIYPDRWIFDLASTGGNIVPRLVGADNNPLSNGTAISAPTQQWHHIAVVNNPVDNYFKAYVNGTLSLSITAQSQPLYNSQHEIGAGWGTSSVGGGEYYIENFQILKGVAKYTSNFTPPTESQGRTYQAKS